MDTTLNNLGLRAQARNALNSSLVPGMCEIFPGECKQLNEALACEEYSTHLLMSKLDTICDLLLDKSNFMPHNKLRIHVFNAFQNLTPHFNGDTPNYIYHPPPTVTLYVSIYLIDPSFIQQPIKRPIGSLFRSILIRSNRFTSLWTNPRGINLTNSFNRQIDLSSSPYIPNSNCTCYEMKNETVTLEFPLIYENDLEIEITLYPHNRAPVMRYEPILIEFFANMGIDITNKTLPDVVKLITDYALENNLLSLSDQIIIANEPLYRLFEGNVELKHLPYKVKNLATATAKSPIVINHTIKAPGRGVVNESYFDVDVDYMGQSFVFPWKPINISAALVAFGSKFTEDLSKLDYKEGVLNCKQYGLINKLIDKIHAFHLYRTFLNSQEEVFKNLMGKHQLEASKPLKSDRDISLKSFSPPWVYRAIHEYLNNKDKELPLIIEQVLQSFGVLKHLQKPKK